MLTKFLDIIPRTCNEASVDELFSLYDGAEGRVDVFVTGGFWSWQDGKFTDFLIDWAITLVNLGCRMVVNKGKNIVILLTSIVISCISQKEHTTLIVLLIYV